MGLFDNFFKDEKEEQIKLVRGYLVTEIKGMYTVEPTNEDFNKIVFDAFEAVTPFIPTFEKELEDLAHTLTELFPENVEEFIGLALPLCWIRYVSLARDVKAGRINEEDAKKYHNLNHLINVIHSQIKSLVDLV